MVVSSPSGNFYLKTEAKMLMESWCNIKTMRLVTTYIDELFIVSEFKA